MSKKKKNAPWHYIQLVILHIQVICFEHMATWKRCCDMQKVCGNTFEDRKMHNVPHNLNVDWRYSRILGYMMIFISVYAEYFKSIQMLAHRASFCYAVDLKLDAYVNLFSHRVSYSNIMCDSRMVINSIFWLYCSFKKIFFCLHLTQFILFTNYDFRQIIICGRQFKFTRVKVVKLGVEQYDYNTSCGNNNVQHNYSDHACLPSRVLKL